jgi:hypothetical protein
MSDKEPLKITLADLGEEARPDAPEPPLTTDEGAANLGHKMGDAVKDSAARAAHKIAGATAGVTSRGAEAVRDKVGEAVQAQSKATADAIETRLREIDWKDEAQKGAEGGLRWLSKRLEELAEKLRAGKQ